MLAGKAAPGALQALAAAGDAEGGGLVGGLGGQRLQEWVQLNNGCDVSGLWLGWWARIPMYEAALSAIRLERLAAAVPVSAALLLAAHQV